LQKRGRISNDEMFGTFNMGLGMILVVDPDEVPRSAQVVGEVIPHTGGERVVIS
jgi:phosphoribosylaminoimidazole (AIR) synthetase